MFAKYVSPDVVFRATFNYYEESISFEKDGQRFTVYHTKYPVPPEPNLVVIEAGSDKEELYFRAFLGKYSGECGTEEEEDRFSDELSKIISPEFRIEGKNLERKLIETLDRIDAGLFEE